PPTPPPFPSPTLFRSPPCVIASAATRSRVADGTLDGFVASLLAMTTSQHRSGRALTVMVRHRSRDRRSKTDSSCAGPMAHHDGRSEEHTSELQSRSDL